jgi:hypothetical protein
VQSFAQHDRCVIAMACLFLAGKVSTYMQLQPAQYTHCQDHTHYQYAICKLAT